MNATTNTPAVKTISIEDCLARAGGVKQSDQSVIFDGQQFNGTGEFITEPLDSIPAYEEAVRAEYEIIQTTSNFDYAVNDVLACSYRVARRMQAGFARTVKKSMFHIPAEKRIEVGYDSKGKMQYETVGNDWTSIPGIAGGEFYVQEDRVEGVVKIHVRHPRLHAFKVAVNGFIDFVRDELKERSIYRGKVITPNFKYIWVNPIDPNEIIYNDDVQSVLGPFGLGTIMFPQALSNCGVGEKVGLCLAGPPGTGKSLFLQLLTYTGEQHGCTVINCQAGGTIDDLERAYKIARQYQVDGKPVVLLFEDIEKLASDDDDRARLLDALDGVEAKGMHLLFVCTTNFPDILDDALLRPGRVDQLVLMQLPDVSSLRQLVQMKLGDMLSPELQGDDNTPWEVIHPHYEGYTQSWIVGSTESVLRAAVWRSQGKVSDLVITADDLIAAATAYRDQYNMQQRSKLREKELPTLDRVFRNLVTDEAGGLDSGDLSDVQETVDSVVEHRLDGARVNLQTESGKEIGGELHTK